MSDTKPVDQTSPNRFWANLDVILNGGKGARGSKSSSYARSVKSSLHVLRDVLGVRLLNPEALSGKHILKLVSHWKTEGVSQLTLSFRIYALRWYCTLINKAGMVPTNAQLGIDHLEASSPNRAESDQPEFNHHIFVKAHALDATLAYLLWLRSVTGCTYEMALRTTGDDLIKGTWFVKPRPGTNATILTIPVAHRALVPAVIKHILEQNRETRDSLGWSRPYGGNGCHNLSTDLRHIKYLAKKLGVSPTRIGAPIPEELLAFEPSKPPF